MAKETAKRGLGSGLGALFGDVVEDSGENIRMLPISKVEPRREQPRYTFDEEGLQDLAESLEKHGMIQPITARRLESGYYQIIAGERRWRAARMAGLGEIPVRVIQADDRKAMELALVENLQREDLNPIEEAKGYQTLIREYGLTQEEAAATVGKSRPAVANALRLLSLCEPVLAMVEEGLISSGHARALLPLDGEQQEATARKIQELGLSVRQTEALCARLLADAQRQEKEEAAAAIPQVDYLEEARKDLERATGRRVTISDGRRRGKITLEYYGPEDREALMAQLKQLPPAEKKRK